VLGIIIGAALTMVTQSSLVVRAILMILYKSNVINLHAAMILTYGAFLGSSLLTIVLTLNISGIAKQVVMFQVLLNIVGNIILIPLLYIENYCNIPAIGALVSFLFDNKGFQVAGLGLLFHLIAGVFMGLLIPVLAKTFAKLYPETIEESISKPQYLFSNVIVDMSSAMKLVEFEQARVIEANTYIFELLRGGKSRNDIEQFFEAIMDLAKLIRDYLSTLPKKYLVEVNVCYKLGILFDIQNSVEMLTIAIKNLSHILVEKSLFEGGKKLDFYNAIVEGIDTHLIITSDVLHEREASFADYLSKMATTGEKEIDTMRESLITSLENESSSVKFKLLSVICDCEKIMMLLNKITEEISVLKSEQKPA
jgi:phosphate:Na+ symporter